MTNNPNELKPCPLGTSEYRISNHMLIKGTIRIAVFDIDTNPCDEITKELYDFILERLNTRHEN